MLQGARVVAIVNRGSIQIAPFEMMCQPRFLCR